MSEVNNLREQDFKRRIVLANQVTMVLLVVSALYIPIFSLLGYPLLSYLLIPIDSAFIVCLFLMRAGFYNIGRLGSILVGNIAAFVYACLLGESAGAQLLFFAFIGMPLVIFSNSEVKKISVGIAIPIISYYVLKITDYSLFMSVGLTDFGERSVHFTAAGAVFLIIILYLRFLLTATSQAEQKLINSNQNLQTAYTNLKETRQIAEKMSLQASFASLTMGIAHEIRNPLTPIRLHAEDILGDPPDAEETRAFASTVMRNVDRILNIVDVMLKYGAPATEGKRNIFLNEVVRDALFLAQSKSRQSRIRVESDMTPEPLIICGDGNRLHQALLNLLLNAIQAIEQEGVIIVRCRRDFFINRDGQEVEGARMEVQDNGKGIVKENLDKIFNPFFTTKYGSTGLGLSMVMKIVDDHSGLIKVESEVGVGTTVIVLLPLVTEDPPGVKGAEPL